MVLVVSLSSLIRKISPLIYAISLVSIILTTYVFVASEATTMKSITVLIYHLTENIIIIFLTLYIGKYISGFLQDILSLSESKEEKAGLIPTTVPKKYGNVTGIIPVLPLIIYLLYRFLYFNPRWYSNPVKYTLPGEPVSEMLQYVYMTSHSLTIFLVFYLISSLILFAFPSVLAISPSEDKEVVSELAYVIVIRRKRKHPLMKVLLNFPSHMMMTVGVVITLLPFLLSHEYLKELIAINIGYLSIVFLATLVIVFGLSLLASMGVFGRIKNVVAGMIEEKIAPMVRESIKYLLEPMKMHRPDIEIYGTLTYLLFKREFDVKLFRFSPNYIIMILRIIGVLGALGGTFYMNLSILQYILGGT